MSVFLNTLSADAEKKLWKDISGAIQNGPVIDTAAGCLDIAMRISWGTRLRKHEALVAQIEISFRCLLTPQTCYGSIWPSGMPSLNIFGPQNPQIPTCFTKRSEYLITQRVSGG